MVVSYPDHIKCPIRDRFWWLLAGRVTVNGFEQGTVPANIAHGTALVSHVIPQSKDLKITNMWWSGNYYRVVGKV